MCKAMSRISLSLYELQAVLCRVYSFVTAIQLILHAILALTMLL